MAEGGETERVVVDGRRFLGVPQLAARGKIVKWLCTLQYGKECCCGGWFKVVI